MAQAMAQDTVAEDPSPTTEVEVNSESAAQPVVPEAVAEAPVEPMAPVVEAGPDPLTKAAAIYATYQSDVTWVRDNPLSSKDDIDRSLTNLGTQNADSLSRGWLAYSAMVAAQTPEFSKALRDASAYYGQDRMITGLRNDLRYARQLTGGDKAVARALAAIEADTRRITGTGAMVKEQAYSLQAKGWAKERFVNPSAKAELLAVSALGGRPEDPILLSALAMPEFELTLAKAGTAPTSLWDHAVDAADKIKFPDFGLGGLGALPVRHVRLGREPVADRIATLAAFSAMGATEPANSTDLSALMNENTTRGCLEKTQLNLQQCVAAAYRQYEVPFCIGEYALNEIGNCLGEVAQ